MDPEIIRQIVKEELASLISADRYTFQQNIQIFDSRDIQLGRATGTKIGTASDQKLAFYGATPVARQAAITAPSGGGTVDSQARTAIGLILTAIKNVGITL